MQRYFVEGTYRATVELTGENYHHIVRVMRMKPDDEVFIVFADQQSFKGAITAITSDSVTVAEREKETLRRELPVEVTIASGLPKGEKLEFVVQKGTELGAHDFIVFPAQTSVVKWDQKKQSKKVQRLQKIAQEAAEQSQRQLQPTVEFFTSTQQLTAVFNDYDAVLVAYEESAKQGERGQLVQTLEKLSAGQRLLVIFGPEGGLTQPEIARFTQAGAKLCGLGPRILRTETAPLYVLAAASFYTELFDPFD